MLALLLVVQLAGGDSTYSTEALKRFIAEAAAANHEPPHGLSAYRALLETDMGWLASDLRGREHSVHIEQVASTLSWRRDGELEQRVIGYRSRGVLTVSGLSLMRQSWIVPTLYGERLQLLGQSPPAASTPRRRRLLAFHPLAANRDSIYRFTGGDTTVQLQFNGRTMHLVRVRVEPHPTRSTPMLVFRGDLFFDADRKQIVRMHGELDFVRENPSLLRRITGVVLEGAFFIDLVAAEFKERYWLPSYQRVDVYAFTSLSKDFRPAFRVITRFREHVIDSLAHVPLAVHADSAGPTRRLTFASADSIGAFTRWDSEMGADVASTTAADFDDVARRFEQHDRAVRLDWRPDHFHDVFRFNRVEGAYTGLALSVDFNEAPMNRPPDRQTARPQDRVSLHTHAGWAWAEETLKGSVGLRAEQKAWQLELTAARELAHTNDFVRSLDRMPSTDALFATIDDWDYVDRSSVNLSVTRALNERATQLLRFEVGPGRDASEHKRVERGLFNPTTRFRPNRPSADGSYVRERLTFELNPAVSGEFLEPGLGMIVSYERGDGDLHWQRLDATLTGRRTSGNFTFVGRLDAAALFGGAIAQKVIEFGGREGLPGYGYKEFGGDRALLLRGGMGYTLPLLRAPMRVWRSLTLPGPAPTLSWGMQSGWADAAHAETRAALATFGTRTDPQDTTNVIPITRPTGNVRTTIAFSLDLFGSVLGIAVARPIDHAAPWKFSLGSALFW